MKRNFLQFIAEKKNQIDDGDVESKFKDVNCDSEDLTEEEEEYCASKKLINFMYKSNQSQ